MFDHRAIRRFFAAAFAFAIVVVIAGSNCSSAQTPSVAKPVARFTAVTANLKGGPNSVRIDVLAWSTDAARSQLVDAWNLIAPAPATAARGAGAAAGGRGAGGRGARGAAPGAAARGGPPPELPSVARDTPQGSLAAALQSAETVGYLWTSESTGYSLKYAYRLTQPDGGERIILATDRRLGAWDDSWQSSSGAATDYAFSIIELRLNGKREGEGKASLTGKVAIDSSANTIALEGYPDLGVILKDVRSTRD
jgi:hypothetical protein